MIKSRLLILAASLALAGAPVYGAADSAKSTTTTSAEAPKTKPVLVNRITKKDRMKMAVAWLKNHPTISVGQYAKITGLKKDIAEAELNVFAQNDKYPIKAAEGKKKLYVLKDQTKARK